MRESIGIYRGKRTDNKEWVEGYYYKEPAPPTCFSEDAEKVSDTHWIVFADPHYLPDWGMPYRMVRVEVDPDTVEQYTGKTDINGKKIFEGDIHENYGVYFVVKHGKFITFDDEESYGWHFERVGCKAISEQFYGNEDEYANIIGNIHDNPELLEER